MTNIIGKGQNMILAKLRNRSAQTLE